MILKITYDSILNIDTNRPNKWVMTVDLEGLRKVPSAGHHDGHRDWGTVKGFFATLGIQEVQIAQRAVIAGCETQLNVDLVLIGPPEVQFVLHRNKGFLESVVSDLSLILIVPRLQCWIKER
jgi:hypothetical protein